MVEVVPDSTPEVQNPIGNQEPLKICIFHADADVGKASRIRQSILRAGYEVNLCEFVAGNSTMGTIDEYTRAHHLVLWMATNMSLGDESILKQARYIAQHAANCTTGMPLRFAVLKPREGFTHTLPHSLDAYTPLIEDNNFSQSLEKTMESIRKKMASTAAARDPPSSATQNAVTDNQDAMPRQFPPISDAVLQADGPREFPLSARPDPGNNLQERASTSVSAASRPAFVENRNVFITVHGNINNLQFGDVQSDQADGQGHHETETPEDPEEELLDLT